MRVLFLYFGHVSFIFFLYPFDRLLSDGLLGFPFGNFPFGTCGDLLDINEFNGHHVYRRLLLIGLDWALATIVAFFSEIVAIHFSVIT